VAILFLFFIKASSIKYWCNCLSYYSFNLIKQNKSAEDSHSLSTKSEHVFPSFLPCTNLSILMKRKSLFHQRSSFWQFSTKSFSLPWNYCAIHISLK
jgi:hypothetical protein